MRKSTTLVQKTFILKKTLILTGILLSPCIFILKTIYFILQNMFRSLHTSSSVVQIKSTVNI